MTEFDKEWFIARLGGCEKSIEILDHKIIVLEKRIRKLQEGK